jgi:hypothetical protein
MKLGLRKLWHCERLPVMLIFFDPWSDEESEREIARSIGSGAPARQEGVSRMRQLDYLYQQLAEAHLQLKQLNLRLASGEDCLDELLDADDQSLAIHRRLRGLINGSPAAAMRFLELRGRIRGGDAA